MIETREAIHLVLEYAAGGSLQQLVTARGRLSEAEVPRDPSSPPNTHTAQCSAPLFPAEPDPDPDPDPDPTPTPTPTPKPGAAAPMAAARCGCALPCAARTPVAVRVSRRLELAVRLGLPLGFAVRVRVVANSLGLPHRDLKLENCMLD